MHDLKTTQSLNQGITGKKMDHKQVAEELYKLVDKYGSGYVYQTETYENEFGELRSVETCTYSTEDMKPSCIVGHIIHKHFPEVFEQLYFKEWGTTHLITSGTAASVAAVHPHMFTEQATGLLQRVQEYQDSEIPWGEAVDRAVTVFANESRRM